MPIHIASFFRTAPIGGAVIAGLVLLRFAAACSVDECESTTRRCSGRKLQRCFETTCDTPLCATSRRWITDETCPRACVQPADQPFCALSETPDPLCGDP